MKQKQGGQALIVVLLALAIASLLAVPLLNLTFTSLRSRQIVSSQTKAFYAADAMQEYVMWNIMHNADFQALFQKDFDTGYLSLNLCGESVNATVIMRAVATWRGVTLIKDTPIKPTKVVSPSSVTYNTSQTYIFTINLEQIGSDTTQGLDAVYDVLPKGFSAVDYDTGSSELSSDNGQNWEAIGDPLIESSQTWPTGGPSFGGQIRLRWPNPYTYGQNNFASPVRDFTGGQIKKIRYRITASLPNNSNLYYYYYSWVVLKPWNTLSGPTGTIVAINNSKSGSTYEGGMVDVVKVSPISFVPPGVPTQVPYTITIKSRQSNNDAVEEISDYLPPGFSYIDGTTSGDLTTNNPVKTYAEVNGVNRWKLSWIPPSNKKSLAAGATKTLTFTAISSQDVSGSYYNEVTVTMNSGIPQIFQTPGVSVSLNDFTSGYSWNTAPVIVPAYDSSTVSEDVTINANLAVTQNGMAIISYQVR